MNILVKHEKKFANQTIGGRNFKLFCPKPKKFSFKRLFLMSFFKAKYFQLETGDA